MQCEACTARRVVVARVAREFSEAARDDATRAKMKRDRECSSARALGGRKIVAWLKTRTQICDRRSPTVDLRLLTPPRHTAAAAHY